MFLRILKRDLKRKRTMNIILLLFVILASMFVASGLNNVITVMNGTGYYFEKAGLGDYVVITMGKNAVGNISKFLDKESEVTDYKIEGVIWGSKDNIYLNNGDKADTKNSLLIQSIEESKINFFDMDNKKIKTVKKGHVYMSGEFISKNHLKVGDEITLKHSGTELKLIVDGKAKDALLGSDFMGNSRMLLSETDTQTLLANEKIYKGYRGEIAYIDTTDVTKLSSALVTVPNVSLSDPISLIKMCYVMDLIVAFITLIMSVCLILVSFAVLKFSISFSIDEEYREIGVMKAIGIGNRKIRNLYIIKYLMLATFGAVIGLFVSIPFGNILLKSVTNNMVLGNDFGIYINIIGVLLVVLCILSFAYVCTGKVKKLSPVDAIRSGQTGERYKKKTIYRIGKSHVSPSCYMALNDVISSPRRFLIIILSFFICTLFVLMLVNDTNTMDSDKLIYSFCSTKSDLYVTDVNKSLELMKSDDKADVQDYLTEMSDKLTDEGMPSTVCVETQYKYIVNFDGKDYYLNCQQGIGTKSKDYKYTEGTAPQNANEIAITPKVSKLIGAKIGDTVTVNIGNEKLKCMVTAYMDTFNQLGELIKLHEDAPADFNNCSSMVQFQISFTDSPSKDEIENRKARIKKLYDNDEIMNAKEYCKDTVGVVDTMKSVQLMLLIITIVVVLLVTILMEMAFISDERGQIAILKAIGFKDKDIIKWHIVRFGFTTLIAVLLAGVLSIPATKILTSPIFGMMGNNHIEFNIVPWQVFGLYPAIVIVATLLSAFAAAQYTRIIKSSDTAYIE